MPLLRVEVERVGQAVFYVNQVADDDAGRDAAMEDARVLARSLDDKDFDWSEFLDATEDPKPSLGRWIWTGGPDGDFMPVGEYASRPQLSVIKGAAS